VFTCGLYDEVVRFSVEQMTWFWCVWSVVETLALFVQCTTHCTANMPSHALWRSNLYIRSSFGTQEFTVLVLQTVRGELSSWDMFLHHEDWCQSRETGCHGAIHRCATFMQSSGLPATISNNTCSLEMHRCDEYRGITNRVIIYHYDSRAGFQSYHAYYSQAAQAQHIRTQ